MLKSHAIAALLSFAAFSAMTHAQTNAQTDALSACKRMEQDTSLNNLAHAPDYVCGELGALGKAAKVGEGPRDMILIAGAGFGGEVFASFMENRKDRYTMYAVTLPGFAGTPAPPMPATGVSYGEQTWTKGAQRGVEALIADQGLKKPIIVGHWWTATQVALGLALDHPDRVSAVVLISGVPRTTSMDEQFGTELTAAQRAKIVDEGYAPQWFKTVTRETWDDNNWYPHDYARNPVRGLQLWRQAFQTPLPVSIRYLCEGWAQDVTAELHRLQVPTLVLTPGLDDDGLSDPAIARYVRAQCQGTWKGAEQNPRITIRTIPQSRVFIMDDQPDALDQALDDFLANN